MTQVWIPYVLGYTLATLRYAMQIDTVLCYPQCGGQPTRTTNRCKLISHFPDRSPLERHSYFRCRHGLFGPLVKLAKRTLPSGTTTNPSTDWCFITGLPIESTVDLPPTGNARAPSLPVGGLEASLGEIEEGLRAISMQSSIYFRGSYTASGTRKDAINNVLSVSSGSHPTFVFFTLLHPYSPRHLPHTFVLPPSRCIISLLCVTSRFHHVLIYVPPHFRACTG
ncbi:hypothetical protein EDD17DRAFT_1118923 [Pisolithus thermaeus]|nr:hypothetical protein EDD17DRAFT_1118923 [Pisolithus thermaeus]